MGWVIVGWGEVGHVGVGWVMNSREVLPKNVLGWGGVVT